MRYEHMTDFIRQNLSKERFEHSLGVAELAKKLAQIYGADTQKAEVAGLLHDCAKEFDKDRTIKLLERIKDLDEIIKNSRNLWHGPAGAEFAKEIFDVDDDVYDAIFYHTIGKVNMPLLTKIIFLADAVEINRDKEFNWSSDLRKLALKDMDASILKVIDNTLISIIQRGLTIHPGSVMIRNSIISSNNGGQANG